MHDSMLDTAWKVRQARLEHVGQNHKSRGRGAQGEPFRSSARRRNLSIPGAVPGANPREVIHYKDNWEILELLGAPKAMLIGHMLLNMICLDGSVDWP
jgi:hypothetical protein